MKPDKWKLAGFDFTDEQKAALDKIISPVILRNIMYGPDYYEGFLDRFGIDLRIRPKGKGEK